MRILVADDDLVFQGMLRALLKQWGYDVVVANNGEEAWRILQSANAPQLAIVDWLMPQLSGIDLCRRVRASKRNTYTYILILTAKTKTEDLIVAMDAGADDYVTKPFKAGELLVRLRAGSRMLAMEERLLLSGHAPSLAPAFSFELPSPC